MLLTKRLTWLVGVATLLSFVGVTIFSLIGPTRDTELVRFAGLNSIKRSDLLDEIQKHKKQFRSADSSQCLNILVAERIMDAFCKEHNTDCSNEVVLDLLKNVPHFCSEEGVFDQSKFDYYLKSEGIGSQEYINKVKKELLSRLTINILSSACSSSYLANALASNRLASRDIMVAHCDVKNTPSPSERELLETYARHRRAFEAPELRSIKYFTVNRTASVSEEEIRAYLARNSSKFGGSLSSVHKQVASIIADSKDRDRLAELRSFISEIVSERDFEKLASKFSSKVFSLEKVKLLDLTQSKLLSSSAREIFASQLKAFADPIVTTNKFLIWYVSDIEPARLLDFAEAKHLVGKKWIETKKQELDSKGVVSLCAKLKDSKVTDQTFVKEAHSVGACVRTFKGVNYSSKVLGEDLLKVTLGLRQCEMSPATFDSSTGRTYVVFVKRLERYNVKPKDLRIDEEELIRAMFFEIQSYLLKKYSPVVVRSIAD